MNGAPHIDLVNVDTAALPVASSTHQAPCEACELQAQCLPASLNATSDSQRRHLLNSLVRQLQAHPLSQQYLFRQSTPFNTLYIVRAGAVKTILLDNSGCEQITGFYYPGDLFGLDGINTHQYATTSVALGQASVCAVDFSRLERISTFVPALQHHIFRMMAREIERNQRMMAVLNHKSADQRVAFLLLRYALHLRRLNQPSQQFSIPMSRRDIANHLGLAVETVSRILSRLQRLALFRIEGRQVYGLDLARLQAHFEAVDHRLPSPHSTQ
ncbi:MAG: helix-turn-helix domain-containing protein [Pseudomonadota bacterium]|nr:helix-turn-helix domain-containing protein [Pseudomonadota bacterium]